MEEPKKQNLTYNDAVRLIKETKHLPRLRVLFKFSNVKFQDNCSNEDKINVFSKIRRLEDTNKGLLPTPIQNIKLSL